MTEDTSKVADTLVIVAIAPFTSPPKTGKFSFTIPGGGKVVAVVDRVCNVDDIMVVVSTSTASVVVVTARRE